MSDPWDPPADLSGGFIVFEMTNGIYQHRQRIHVAPFDASSLDYASAHGSTTNISDDLSLWATQWERFYNSAWTLTVLSLWQIVSGVRTQVLPPPTLSQPGTASSVAPTSVAGEWIFNFKSIGGHRGRIAMITADGWTLGGPQTFVGGSGNKFEDVVAALSGTDTGFVCHDGTKFTNYARVTSVENRRLRRHFHLD